MQLKNLEASLANYISKKGELANVEADISRCISEDAELSKAVFTLLKDYLDNSLIDVQIFTHLAQFTRAQIQKEDIKTDYDDDRTVIDALLDDDRTIIQTITPSGDESEDAQSVPNISASTTSPTNSTSNSWSQPFVEDAKEIQLQVGSVIKERFKLIQFIGHGGMGDVYKAEDLRRLDAGDIESYVAIKVLNKEFREHPDSLRALQREARKTQGLAHPHIVNVYDFDRDNFHVFMTMEFMIGRPLNEVLREHKTGFDYSFAIKYVSELCDALHYAHRRGVVHSDLKPNNVFLTTNNEIKIFDFGIARAAGIATNSTQQMDTFDAGVIGALTPAYASPEMLDEENEADVRDDIYALGCIVYEVFTGSHPFVLKGKKIPGNIAKQNGMQPGRIKGLSKRQQSAVEKCLVFDRNNRMKSVTEFKNAFFNMYPLVTTRKLISAFVGFGVITSVLIYAVNYYSNKDINNLIALIESRQLNDVHAEVSNLLKQDKAKQARVFEDSKLKIILRDYLRDVAIEQAEREEFNHALKTLKLAAEIYSDSIEINTLESQVAAQRNARVIEIYEELDSILADRESVIKNHGKIFPILTSLAKVDDVNKRLENTQPLFKLQEAISYAIDSGNFILAEDIAKSLILVVESRDAFDTFRPQMLAQNARIDELKLLKLNQQRVHELLKNTVMSKDSSLENFISYQDNLKQLVTLAPDNPDVILLQDQLFELLNSRVNQLITTKDWQTATALTEKLNHLVSDSKLSAIQMEIEKQRSSYATGLTKMMQDIQDFARNEQPEKAALLLRSLDVTQLDYTVIRDLNDAVATSWLLAARQGKTLNQWTNAQQFLANASELDTSAAIKQQLADEQGSIKQAQLVYAQQTKEQEERLALDARQREIEKYVSDITDKFQQDDFSVAELSSIRNSLDRLTEKSPGHPILETAPKQFVDKILAQLERLAINDLNEALSFAKEANSYLGNSADINNAIADIDLRISRQQVEEKQRLLAHQEKNIIDSISVAGSLRDFDKVKAQIREYSGVQSDQTKVNDITQKARLKLIELANVYATELRFEQANKLIKEAVEFGLSRSEAAPLFSKIEKLELAQKRQLQQQEKESQIESLTQSALAFLQVANFSGADKIKQDLVNLGGISNDVTRVIENAYGKAYFKKSSESYSKLDIDSAENWLEKALQHDPENATFIATKPRYRAVSAILNARTRNPTLAHKLKQSAIKMFPNDSIIMSIDIETKLTSTSSTNRSTVSRNTTNAVVQQDIAKSVPCRPDMAGKGNVFTCRDVLTSVSSGPYLIVLPSFNGKSLAMTKYEIRIGEFNIFCTETKSCTAIRGDELEPATGLSIADIGRFTNWLTRTTGNLYRLPTVAEWRYAAQANGEQPTVINCRIDGDDRKIQPVNFERLTTSNGWGLSNYLGNAQEIATVRNGHVALGGYYLDDISQCNVNFSRFLTQYIDNLTGFRLVRELKN
ncbi:protein kinase domain-containing protein [Rheinheimera maricola]|uniref:Protein kinase n=1 Tax=Rheinheimera maricola TaxID=2793282 RepID=A0ABS7XEF6_9GAMM|nr:protein kinase [Rheinheimera maricola]MBZ9613440.1 protein kinase [Rheinheimera maricola]